MANVYSIRQYSSGGTTSAGEYNSAPVPSGFVWVVRSIEAYLDQQWLFYAQGIKFRLNNSGGATMAAADRPGVRARLAYHWQLHTVLQAGETVHVSVWDNGWGFFVSGYQLTLP